MPEIARAEAEQINLYRNAAATAFYRRAKFFSFLGSGVAALLALLVPVAIFVLPSWGPALGAVSAGWLFFSRFGLERFRREWQSQGALAQEAYDCAVLGLVPNPALGVLLTPEEIRAGAAAHQARLQRAPWWKPWADPPEPAPRRSWYPSEGAEAWPLSVLLCQRSNAVWAARQHRSYAYLLSIAVIGWGAFGIALALLHGAELSEYLTTILLPSLPAFLDTTENAGAHLEASTRRANLGEVIKARIDGDQATESDLREIQDELFALRRHQVHVPEAYYKRIKADYERDMRFGAAQTSAEAPAGEDS